MRWVFGSVIAGFLAGSFLTHKELTSYDDGFGTGFAKGYKTGAEDALRPNAANHKLEDVCVGMWISQQIKEQK